MSDIDKQIADAEERKIYRLSEIDNEDEDDDDGYDAWVDMQLSDGGDV